MDWSPTLGTLVYPVCSCRFIHWVIFQKDISVYETGQKQLIHYVPTAFQAALPACSSMGSKGGRARRDASEAHKGTRGTRASGSFNFQTTFRRIRISKSNPNQLSVLNWSTKERRLRKEKPWRIWKWFGEGSY